MSVKLGRFKDQAGSINWGIVSEDKVEIITPSPFNGYRSTGEKISLQEVELIPPVNPGKIICVGLNYRDHAREIEMDIPRTPLIFLKAPSSVTGPDTEIIKPNECVQMDFEGELAAIVGKPVKKISSREASDCLLGYTCFNDVTARDIQRKESQWSRAKSYDTFSPLGPFIVSDIDPGSLGVRLFLNGHIKQNSNTRNMIFSVDEIVSFISKIMTLYPGDVIATGTPPGVGPMEPGDRVKIEIEKIGNLENTVRKEK